MIEFRVKFYGDAWRRKGVLSLYIRVIKDMYEGGRMSVRLLRGVTKDFFIGRGLHQGALFFSL